MKRRRPSPSLAMVTCESSAAGTSMGRKERKRKVHTPEHGVDVNDIFPDEILLHIFSYIYRAENCWNAAKVCKRWCILQAYNQLRKQSRHTPGHYPCIGWRAWPFSCKGALILKLKKVESEWRLAMELLKSCRRHTQSLEIKNCTHLSAREYQLIAAFASNLRFIRLEACDTMDDASLDIILDKCHSLLSIQLSKVPKVALSNIEKKASTLEKLHVYGCRLVTETTVLAVLNGCPKLKSLSLSAMGVSRDDMPNIGQGPALKLQTLQLSNTLAVTDGFLRAMSGRFSNLRNLDLSDCASVSDDGFKAMIASCGSRLQKLVVSQCPRLSDDTVCALADVAANLRDLTLAGTNLSDDGLRTLVASKGVVFKLRHLSLACCSRVTDAGLEHMVAQRKKLVSFKVLDVQGCPNISEFKLRSIKILTVKRPWKIVSSQVNLKTSE